MMLFILHLVFIFFFMYSENGRRVEGGCIKKREIIKINWYFNKIVFRINNLKWVFLKNNNYLKKNSDTKININFYNKWCKCSYVGYLEANELTYTVS